MGPLRYHPLAVPDPERYHVGSSWDEVTLGRGGSSALMFLQLTEVFGSVILLLFYKQSYHLPISSFPPLIFCLLLPRLHMQP